MKFQCFCIFFLNFYNLIIQLKFSEIFCLVNNAGVMTYAQTEWQTKDQIKNQINVNLGGTIQVTKALLPYIRRSKGMTKQIDMDSLASILVFLVV